MKGVKEAGTTRSFVSALRLRCKILAAIATWLRRVYAVSKERHYGAQMWMRKARREFTTLTGEATPAAVGVFMKSE